ncbi:MAG: UPF0182 family protein [bacterium]|nr:UPF0182 family protein [bacterium]
MKNLKYILLPFAVITLFIIFYSVISLYPEVLWFESFGFDNIWWFVFRSKAIVFAFFAAVAYFWLVVNINIAKRVSSDYVERDVADDNPFSAFVNQFFIRVKDNFSLSPEINIKNKVNIIVNIGLICLSVFMGLSAKVWWQEIYEFIHGALFNLSDPVFNKDISFYIFSLPLIKSIQAWLLWLLFFSILIAGAVYFSKNILKAAFNRIPGLNRIKSHLFILLGLMLLVITVGKWLQWFDLLYSVEGIVFGAGYTDIHARLLAYRIITLLFFIESIILFIWAFRPGFKVPVYFLGGIIVVSIVLGGIYPGLVQSYIVEPNEMVKEQPYIENSIKYTRRAYNLDKIEEQPFSATNDLNYGDIKNNPAIIDNIRLWNQEPIKKTFSQLQEIRLYYEFQNIDVDRYMINNSLQQVMLSARELDSTKLTQKAQTWTNRHLVYTHGYGLCMSPVSKITKEGLPYFYVKDLPPVSSVGISISRPEIYFGEITSDYIIVNTKEQEFNYPKGDQNEYTKYAGKGGIVLDNFSKRFVYALKFSDLKFLISSLINSDSRLLYDRDIKTIVQKIAPFLFFDRDPYLTITAAGRLVWVIDGYTVSNNFPYSDKIQGQINYIRNAVKATVDAYDGKVSFYITDKKDPVIETYSRIYKGMFKKIDEMPHELKQHFRYPKEMFLVQAHMYKTYHMTNPRVFYNREDLWGIPKQKHGDTEEFMDAYYMVTKLPGETKDSFVLMLPFTPSNKNNMISWMVAKSDIDEYGKIKVYKFPKERTIYGPMQIESRIDQDTEISQKLTLWGQAGSRVIRGNIMVVPIKDSLLYMEPIYLQATQSKFPELKRVIVSYDDKVIMDDNLDDAIASVFGHEEKMKDQEEAGESLDPEEKSEDNVPSLLKSLLNEFKSFKNYAVKNDWAGFGKSLEGIDKLVEKLIQFEALKNNKK